MDELDRLLAEGTAFFAEHGDDLAAQAEAIERAQRIDDARALTKEQLPGWLQVRACDLRLRIREEQLEQAVAAWEWGQNLLLMGKTGIGKTNALALLWRRLMCRGITCGGKEWDRARRMVWARPIELAEARRRHPLGRGDVPEWKAARDASLLFLDDLDSNEEARDAVWKIIAYRYDAPAATVMSTGLDPDELTGVFGAPVLRKMRQTGGRKALVVNAFEPEPRPIKGTSTPRPDGKSAAAGET